MTGAELGFDRDDSKFRPRAGHDLDRVLDGIAERCSSEGWNGYSTPAVGERAVAAARAIVHSLYVVPTNRGGISITLAGEDISIELDAEGRLIEVYAHVTDTNEFVDAVLARTTAVAPREHDLSATAVSADATPATPVDVGPERTV